MRLPHLLSMKLKPAVILMLIKTFVQIMILSSHLNKAQVQLVADASDPNVANTLANYATAIIMDYQDRITNGKKLPYAINTEMQMLYNPQLKGAYNFVPGVMAMVLM